VPPANVPLLSEICVNLATLIVNAFVAFAGVPAALSAT
jgi:hypothetical protein